jgi:hypothetical protein
MFKFAPEREGGEEKKISNACTATMMNSAFEDGYRRWLSQTTTCIMPKKKRERRVAEWAEWDEQLSSSCDRAIVTESAAGAARFDRRHRLRQNCRTQRRRKRASNLRKF